MSAKKLSEEQLKELLDWPLACDAVEQAFKSDEKKTIKRSVDELKAATEGTEIPAWRAAAASIVATKYFYLSRPSAPKTKNYTNSPTIKKVAIIGCGAQVRIIPRKLYVKHFFQ